jgi:hypothetical protein
MKPPSLIFEEFLSPLKCRDDNVLKIVEHRFTDYTTIIEQYYNVNVKEISSPILSNDCNVTCDNSRYKRNWIRKNDYDFTGYIALSNYSKDVPFDEDYDVYGGELIFKNYGIQISPTMGDLIIFPSCANFLHYHNKPMVGTFNYIKLFITCENPYIFNFKEYSHKPFSHII